MKTYTVNFAQHYNENGETDDYPTDYLRVVNDVIRDFMVIEYEGLPENVTEPGYCAMIVDYEVDDADAAYFEKCLDDCETVKSYSVA